MKTTYIMSACGLLFALAGCMKDLDVEPIDPNVNAEPDKLALANKCYAAFICQGQGGADGDCDIDGLDGGTTSLLRQGINANSVSTDEAICNWGDQGVPEYNFNTWGAAHPMLQGYYYRLYVCITNVNFYLGEYGDDDELAPELRFLRAYCYYMLMDNYGNTPLVTTVSAEKGKQVGREGLFEFVESELKAIEPAMREPKWHKSTDVGEYGRVDRAACWQLLARLYLNAEVFTGQARWGEAKEYAKKVIDSPYDLNRQGNDNFSAYQLLFMGDNGENGASVEALFTLLQDGVETTAWGGTLFPIASTMGNFDKKPIEWSVGGKTYSGNGTSANWGGIRLRPDLVQKFVKDASADNVGGLDVGQFLEKANDDRALFSTVHNSFDIPENDDFSKGTCTVKFTNWYSTCQYGDDGKAIASGHNSQFPDADWFMMRAAESWLIYAEADARLNGGKCTGEGKDILNDLRGRAHADPLSDPSLNQICDEWAREFYLEGYRRPTLIRFGRYGGQSDYKWQWMGGLKEGAQFPAFRNVFAIPAVELNANENLQQNPGY